MLPVARQIFSSPELVSLILSHIDNERELARLALVAKSWSWEAARHPWEACTQLLHLEHKVRSTRHERVASLICHLRLNLVIHNMPFGLFSVYEYVRDDAAVDPEVWLGSNRNFCPDPRQWASRRLYEPGAELNWVVDDHEKVEDDLLVWGNGTEQDGMPTADSGVNTQTHESDKS